MARPVAAVDGHCWANLDGRLYRCNEWLEGTIKQNEETSVADAAAMGRLVAHLHALAIPCVAPPPPPPVRRERWEQLLAVGRDRGAPWASPLEAGLDQIVVISSQPRPVELGRDELVGSHGDLNAHNVMFSLGGLRLIDWDAAGPAWPPWERANYSMLWAQRLPNGYDEAAVIAFLRSYLDGGGVVDIDDPAALGAAPPRSSDGSWTTLRWP